MSIEIIRHSERVTTNTYGLFFESKKTRGWGYCFDCDEKGNVDVDALNPTAKGSWELVHTDPEFDQPVIQTFINRHTEPAVGRCSCGAEVILDGFTNTCKCGRDYNMSGQLLAPRSQWGEETGETASDILRGGDPFED